ncbi:MarR family winged helix-turn-helix transcriptional regulator [Neobacillus cucumis]|uniref:MarR family winged helix-turn-helix transcriptional regulator n=1 Tax=Neobacillus cucumis TaxID=1740721 RepID=UPI0028532842|nr:MarR family winged helix-turn-helix transcriptional regulator [Neobacillus cucumis]MDR4949722.1 MarR family winged helix-turn-helix transcriptional regulator [Neobacillus cucumis]
MDKSTLFYKLVSFTSSVHRVTTELTKDVRSDYLTQVQYKILEYIAVSQPVTPSDVSECQNISMPNTSRELRKLMEKGLIEKITDTDDRRKQFICLSENGKTMMNEAFAFIESRFLHRMQNASEEDLAEIEHALEILQSKVFY